MAIAADNRTRTPARADRAETLEYRVIFAAAFVVFLGAAVIERLLPHRLFSQSTDAEPKKSVLAQAKGAAKTCATYAFMG